MNSEKEKISESFNDFMLNSKLPLDELHKIVNSLSFYIVRTNKDYKYNLTYLDSYCESFYCIKNSICRKQNSVEYIVNEIEKYFSDGRDKKIIISLDGYWNFDIDYYDSHCKSQIHFGEINDKLLLYPKIYVEIVRFSNGKESNYSTYFETDKESINTTIKEIMEYFS